MTFHTRNSDSHAHRISESTVASMKQLWAAVLDQAVMDATTRGEEWFDAMDFLLTPRSDAHLGIVGIDPDIFRKQIVASMFSDEGNRINGTRRRTFRNNHAQWIERKRQSDLF